MWMPGLRRLMFKNTNEQDAVRAEKTKLIL